MITSALATPASAELRANLFEILRRHNVGEQCFAEVAALTFVRPAPSTSELGFDPTMEVGDEVFPHDVLAENAPSAKPVAVSETVVDVTQACAPASDVAPVGGISAAKLARAINPSLWDDDPKVRHAAASPYDVAASQQQSLNKAHGILARLYAHQPIAQPVDPVAGEGARLSRVEPVARAGIVARNAWDAIRPVGGKFWRELPDDMQTLAICSARDGYELGRDNALAALQGPAA